MNDTTVAERIAAPDLSTIGDRSTWTTRNNRIHTHPGIPGWEIIQDGPRTFSITGLFDGQDGHPFGKVRTWDTAVALITCLHGF